MEWRCLPKRGLGVDFPTASLNCALEPFPRHRHRAQLPHHKPVDGLTPEAPALCSFLKRHIGHSPSPLYVSSSTMTCHSFARRSPLTLLLLLLLSLLLLPPPTFASSGAAVRVASTKWDLGATRLSHRKKIFHLPAPSDHSDARVPVAVASAAQRWTEAGKIVLAALALHIAPGDSTFLAFEASIAASTRLLEAATAKLATKVTSPAGTLYAALRRRDLIATEEAPGTVTMWDGANVASAGETNRTHSALQRRRRDVGIGRPPCPRSERDWMELMSTWTITNL